MKKIVMRLNIQHYRNLLAEPIDEGKREMVRRLLAEEEAKLAALADPPERKEG